MPDNDCIIIAGGDPGAEFLPVLLFKILLACHQYLRAGIKPQELTGPLQRQVIGHHEHALIAESEALRFHGCRSHFKGLACADLVRQQRIAAIEHMGDGVSLMLPEHNVRVHTDEMNVLSIILTGTGGIKELVIASGQCLAPLRVFPYPVPEGILDSLLFLLSKGRFLFVQHPALFAVRILHLVIDTHILQVQRILQDLIGIGTAGAVGHITVDIAV